MIRRKGFILLFMLVLMVLIIAGCGSSNSSKSAPSIPHSTEGKSDCLSCHKDGIGDAKKTPHPDKTDCTSCHKPAGDSK